MPSVVVTYTSMAEPEPAGTVTSIRVSAMMLKSAAPTPVKTTDRVSPSADPKIVMTSPALAVAGARESTWGGAASTTPSALRSSQPKWLTEKRHKSSVFPFMRHGTDAGFAETQLPLSVPTGPLDSTELQP